MKLEFVSQATAPTPDSALFFIKDSVLFSEGFSKEGSEQVEAVLKGIEKGVFEDLEFAEIDGIPTVFVNACKERGLSPLDKLRMGAYRLSQWAAKKQIKKVRLKLEGVSPEQFKAIAHGLYAACYVFDAYKSKKKESFNVIFEIVSAENKAQLKKIADEVFVENKAITLAKNLVNTPAADLTPVDFLAQARSVVERTPGLSIKVRDVKSLKKEGFLGHVVVGKGSMRPPYMVTISYKGTKKSAKEHLVLVGKGLTFDTGGLCLKPPKSMPEMISDMTGAATVLAAIQAIATLKLPIKVSAVLCLAENAIGNTSVLPGDIFTAKNGKTIAVDNTDAEGRLVLTDGLCEAGLLKATHIVDVATLTGAIVRALGTAIAGLFSNDDDLALALINAGEISCEKLWSMPLEEEYADALKDKFADLKNTGGDAGSIAAALFLNEFVPENTAWAHLDIAGTAFVTKKWKYTEYGATGFGVQTLIELARTLSGNLK